MVRLLVSLLILATLTLSGCGGQNDTYRVTGKVVFPDGTALTQGKVIFNPVSDSEGRDAEAIIQPDGSFTLGTSKPGDGAFPGAYRVAIHVARPPKGSEDRTPPIDPRYRSSSTSGLEAEVKPHHNNRFTFTVERPE